MRKQLCNELEKNDLHKDNLEFVQENNTTLSGCVQPFVLILILSSRFMFQTQRLLLTLLELSVSFQSKGIYNAPNCSALSRSVVKNVNIILTELVGCQGRQPCRTVTVAITVTTEDHFNIGTHHNIN
jgi:hypothetical protein